MLLSALFNYRLVQADMALLLPEKKRDRSRSRCVSNRSVRHAWIPCYTAVAKVLPGGIASV